jgi:hypothetical protein
MLHTNICSEINTNTGQQKNICLIGLIGNAGSGKSTVAKYLVDKGFYKLSFSDPLKRMLIMAGLSTYDELYIKKSKTARWLMQKIGTDIVRNQIDKDFWIKKLKENIDYFLHRNIYQFVIDDVRFINEADFVKSYNGILIKINRDVLPYQGIYNHESESELQLIKCDYEIVNNGSIDDLKSSIDNIISEIWEK